MEHLALYRKWRPQTFGALVGQAENAKILRHGVAQHRHAHAYLFCGTRGTGKTSTARILAKALNCQNPQDGEPCNQCPSCQAITAGRALDVLEIDAASNRGIDEVRDLLEKVHFVPAEGRYKVYIIDEAHMLTTEAFNALLKTFEEPPAHVIFILATTEPRKIPLTILSRCQRYDFKPIDEGAMAAALKSIAAEEGLDITDEALLFLAQKAKGSMRDALSLLDQGMGAGEESLTLAGLSRILGSVLTDFWPGFVRDIAKRDIVSLFASLDTLAAEGKDLRTLFSDFRELLGDMLSYNGAMNQGYGKIVASCRGSLTPEQIIALLTILGEGESAFRYQRDNKVVCRFLLAKMLQELGNMQRTPVVAREVQPPVAATATVPAQVPVSPQAPAPAQADQSVKPPDPPQPVSPQTQPIAAASPSEQPTKVKQRVIPVDNDEEIWSQILAATKKISSKTYTWLSRSQLVKITEQEVIVAYYDSDAMYRDKMEQPDHQAAVLQAISEVMAKEMQFKIDKGRTEPSLFD